MPGGYPSSGYSNVPGGSQGIADAYVSKSGLKDVKEHERRQAEARAQVYNSELAEMAIALECSRGEYDVIMQSVALERARAKFETSQALVKNAEAMK
jgi:hypothetical protein